MFLGSDTTKGVSRFFTSDHFSDSFRFWEETTVKSDSQRRLCLTPRDVPIRQSSVYSVTTGSLLNPVRKNHPTTVTIINVEIYGYKDIDP